MIAALFVLPPLRHDALSRLRLREVFSQEEGVVCVLCVGQSANTYIT